MSWSPLRSVLVPDPMKGMRMEDTWVSRDLPVLDAVVRLFDGGAYAVTVLDVADETGLDTEAVNQALSGPYITEYASLQRVESRIPGTSPRSRLSLGAWSGNGRPRRAWPPA